MGKLIHINFRDLSGPVEPRLPLQQLFTFEQE